MKPWQRIWSSADVPSIYRIHEPPDPKRIMDFEEIAATFRLFARRRSLCR